MRKIIISTTVIDTIELFLIDQIKFFQNNGWHIIIIAGKGQWTTLQKLEKKLGLKIYTVPFCRKVSILNDLVSLVKVLQILLSEKPEVIHYMTPKAALICSIASYLVRIKLRVYSEWGLPYFGKRGLYKAIMKNIDKLTCALSTHILPNSHSNMNYLSNKKICNKSKMHVIAYGSSHGVNTEKFNKEQVNTQESEKIKNLYGISSTDIVIGFVGRLTIDKGLKELIDASYKVFNNSDNIHLLMVGLIDNRDSIADDDLNNFISLKNVHLVKNTFEVVNYYSIMDLFVLPSHREGFPNVVLEASAMSLPVITTDALGCIDSVINNKTGIIVPRKNSTALADAMIKLCKDKKLRKEMGETGRNRIIRDFDPKEINKELLSLYEHKQFFITPQV